MRPVSPDESRSEEDFDHGLGRAPWSGIITTTMATMKTMANMATLALMTTTTMATMAPVLQVKVQVGQGQGRMSSLLIIDKKVSLCRSTSPSWATNSLFREPRESSMRTTLFSTYQFTGTASETILDHKILFFIMVTKMSM